MTPLEAARAEVARLEYEIAQKQAMCDHAWSAVKYTPKVTPGYYAEDYHGRLLQGQAPPRRWVPEVVTDRWERACPKCGKVEQTTRCATQTLKKPEFGS